MHVLYLNCASDSKFCGTCKAILVFHCLMPHYSAYFSFVCIGGHRVKETGHSEGGAEGSDGKVDNMKKYIIFLYGNNYSQCSVTFGSSPGILYT